MPVPLIYRKGRNKELVTRADGYSDYVPQVGWRVHLRGRPGDEPKWYKIYAIEVNIRGEIEAMVHGL